MSSTYLENRVRTRQLDRVPYSADRVLGKLPSARSTSPIARRPRWRTLPGLLLTLAASTASATPDTIDLGAFRIDRTEVTVARVANFLKATGRTTSAEQAGGGFEWGAGWERRPGWTFRAPSGRPARPDDPAAHLDWFEADALCRWAGGQLPSRDQWARAAYTEQRATPPAPLVTGRTYPYPTGDSTRGANLAGDGDGFERHAPAGATVAGVNGLHEMAGNLWEWLADARGDERLTAGGSWWYGAAQTRLEGMQWKPARFHVVYVGFRCVYPAR
jgi:formylglycine-generating enzyme required for sulfatase activity